MVKISDEDYVEGYEFGVDGYICKLFCFFVLFVKIDNLLKWCKCMGVDFCKQLVFEVKELNYILMDEVFIWKVVDCVNVYLSDCDFEYVQFMVEMGMVWIILVDKLKLLIGFIFFVFISNVCL